MATLQFQMGDFVPTTPALKCLNRDHLDILCSTTQTLDQTASQFCRAFGLGSDIEKNGSAGQAKFRYFDIAVDLVVLIHAIIANPALVSTRPDDPACAAATAIVNTEFVLFRITAAERHPDDGLVAVPLRMFQLPFLDHWLGAVVDGDATATITRARAYVVAALLSGRIENTAGHTPDRLIDQSAKSPPPRIDVRLYRSALATLNLESPTEPVPLQRIATDKPTKPAVDIATIIASRSRSRFSIADLDRFVSHDPADAVWTLTHLSVDLASAELMGQITEPNTRAVFERAGVDVGQLVRDFIQHGLRLVEGVGRGNADLPSPSSQPQHSVMPPAPDDWPPDNSTADSHSDDLATAAYTISVLSLLIRSLVSRRLLSANDLLWESRELLYRYPWVPEVRSLREMFSTPNLPAA